MLLVTVLSLALSQDPSGSYKANEAHALEDVVVTTAVDRPDLDVFSFFETLCFDGNRLQGHALVPDDDVRWVSLDNREQSLLGVHDDKVTTRLLETETVTLLLKIEERSENQLKRNVCTLTIAGEHNQASLATRMAGIFHAAGTRYHLDYEDSYETLPGWTQLAWAAIPNRRTTDWRVSTGRRSDPGFVVIVEPYFYISSRYVVGELQYTQTGERPVSVISLTHLFKP